MKKGGGSRKESTQMTEMNQRRCICPKHSPSVIGIMAGVSAAGTQDGLVHGNYSNRADNDGN